ncbi:DoxX family protein (plasmid) [Streptomyces goshikiensis]|uniref:DoxX family protein n=1 Tax=Streptomyces goshikiensis TaxID=1942 RepID=A0ABZ1RXV5_9ACTN|nr:MULTISPECIES: DoxX family protein [Streptomyces]MBP0932227.1 DoxX family protein [Streptomyces sp. KCTC 0041BP]OKI42837.1 DoxX family protein [Streptomyces sp. CB03578]OKI61189.1 DoxX family protein [Streptomyces sp. MJM1172]PJN17573.1 DoxX family protein [Streptomyces sp. CB02120-2]RPK28978.1 putative oxidoreductase MhqP [Streptomyces sp. ADI91-18]
MAHERWDRAVYRATPAPATTVTHDVGLLVLRLFLGLTMAAHGTQKLFGWFGGPGLDATGKGFSMSGYPAGDAMAVIAGLAETLGGLGLALGLLTPLAGAALIGVFVNILDVRGLSPFFAPKGVELELALLAGIVALTLTGPGRFSVDHFLPVLRESRPRYSVLGLVLGVVAGVVVLLVRD